MILKLLDFQQLFKIEMAFILTYLIDFTTRTGLQGLSEIDSAGWKLINKYRNLIEPDLADNGRYSHISLRGAAAKVDMNIMKISANLHLLSHDVGSTSTISNECVKSAILIVNDLLEHQLSMLTEKGLTGKNAAHNAILRMFDNSPKLSDRQIITSRSNVAPFKDSTGNKANLIRMALLDLVNSGILSKTGEGTKSIYTFTPTTTTTTTTKPLEASNLLNSG